MLCKNGIYLYFHDPYSKTKGDLRLHVSDVAHGLKDSIEYIATCQEISLNSPMHQKFDKFISGTKHHVILIKNFWDNLRIMTM